MSRKPNYFKTTTLGDLQRQRDNIADVIHGYKPLNGNELRVLEYLAAMDSKIIESGETMRERLKDIPNGWRQWRLMAATLSNLLVALYGKIPLPTAGLRDEDRHFEAEVYQHRPRRPRYPLKIHCHQRDRQRPPARRHLEPPQGYKDKPMKPLT